MDVLIGRCGVACGLCKRYDHECLGCEEENIKKVAIRDNMLVLPFSSVSAGN